jgi:S-formylglutathione hydrolase FrmB
MPRPVSRASAKTRGRVVLEEVASKVLRDNPLGDPFVRTLPVYLPPGYDDSRRRYPVIFVLAGFLASGRMSLNVNHFSEPLDARLDRLIRSGRMEPSIVVMPDAFTSYGGSQYLNSRATGRYADYIAKELVPHVDRTYRTLAESRHRAVVGKSSGGYGAIVHGMKFPEVWGAVASHSGDMVFEYCYLPEFPKAATEIGKAGGVAAWWKKFRAARKKSWSQFLVLNTLGMAAAYSPARRGGIDLPFDLETGALETRVWERWLAWDPVRMLAAHRSALRGMRLVFVDAGSRDEWNLHIGARIFALRARALGIKITHEEFDDGHMDISYRYDVSLPLVARAIS